MKAQHVFRAKRKAVASTGVDYKASYKMIKSYAQVIINHILQSLALVWVHRVYNQ